MTLWLRSLSGKAMDPIVRLVLPDNVAICAGTDSLTAERSYLEARVAERSNRQAVGLCGLFVVAFLMAGRQVSTGRWLAVAGLAPFFIWWKSALSQSAISTWNNTAPFTIGRTVDLSDTIALVVLPVAVWAAASVQPFVRRPAIGWGILGAASAGIVATSAPPVTIRAEPLELQDPANARAMVARPLGLPVSTRARGSGLPLPCGCPALTSK